MTDEQMLKEIIERRRQWGETRFSDFDWLINHIETQQKELRITINLFEMLKKDHEYLIKDYEKLRTNSK